MNRREELQERYEEALFALLMDDVAMAQGKEAEEENERLKNDPTFEIPEDVDKRCLQTIRRHFVKERVHVAGHITGKILKNAILVAGIVALLFTGAFAASETVRVNTINLIVEVFDTNTLFQFENHAEEVVPKIHVGWVPEGYTLESYGCDSVGTWYQYVNSDNKSLYINCTTTSGAGISLDTEDAEVEYIDIQGSQATLITKENILQLVWPANENTIFIGIIGSGMDREDLIQVANELIY